MIYRWFHDTTFVSWFKMICPLYLHWMAHIINDIAYQNDLKISMLESHSLRRAASDNVTTYWLVSRISCTPWHHYCFINAVLFSLSPHFHLEWVHGLYFSQFPSWQDPQAAVHSSPYFLQLHLNVLQPPTQLQWIILSRTSGAGVLSIITGISLSPCKSQPHFVGSIFLLQPIHTMTWR